MNIQELTKEKYAELKLILIKRFKHTKKRLMQRYGLEITENTYYYMINEVVTNNSVLLEKNEFVEFHCIYYNKTNIIVVYEPKTLSIKTALGLEQFR